MRAATRLQAIGDDWASRSSELGEALTYNRKLWTALVAAATNPDHPLPEAIRQNIANLGLFIFNHTLGVLIEPAPEKLGVLVSINREVAGGLRAMSAPAPVPAAA